MKFASSFAIGASFVATALAASNAFTAPLGNVTVQAGGTLAITWTNSSGSTVDLLLKQGDANNLHTVATIGSDIPNQGGVSWTVPTDLATGEYALELEAEGQDPNYTSFFTIIGQNITSSSSSESAKSTTTAGALVATGSQNATSAAAAASTNATIATNSSSANVSAPATANATSNSTTSQPTVGFAGGNSTAIGGGHVNRTASASSSSTGSAGLGAAIPGEATSTGSPATTSGDSSAQASSTGASSASSGSSASSSGSSSSTSGAKNNAALASWSAYAVSGALGAALFFFA